MKSEQKYEALTLSKVPPEKLNRILEAAVDEFAEYGYDRANINDIAKNAGVSVGSMYKYFTSKEDLYLTVVHMCVLTIKNALDHIVRQEVDLFTRIEMIIRTVQAHSRRHVNLTRLYNGMTTENRYELTWTVVSQIEGVTADLYASYFREAQEAGLVRQDVDARYFAFFLDNLFVILQFSYASEYYKDRLRMFVGDDAFNQDELMVEQLMKFIRGAFSLE